MQPDQNEEAIPPKASARAELSEREQEILKLVATGASNKQIAQQLIISPNTVKVHLRNIFGKIGVATRTEAALYAIRTGLVGVIGDLPTFAEEDSPAPPNGELPGTPAVEASISTAPGAPDSLAASAAEAAPGPAASPARVMPRWFGISVIAALLVLLTAVSIGYWRTMVAPATATQASVVAPQWQSLAPLPSARSRLATVVYENNIYAIAGEAADGVTGAADRYDPSRNTWIALASKPLPVADVEAAVIGGHIYVPGGRQASGAMTSEVEVYDTASNAWTRAASLPQAISAYALVAHEGRLYLFGGWDGRQYLSSAYVYDPVQDQWKPLAPMPAARGFAGAAEAAGRIYVIGGFDGQQALAGNLVFMPELQDSAQSPWETTIPLPEARYGSGVTSLADTVYTFGGEAGAAQDLRVLGYSPLGKGWQPLQVPPLTRWSHMGLVALGSRLFVIGGLKDAAVTNLNMMCQVVYTVLLPVVQ